MIYVGSMIEIMENKKCRPKERSKNFEEDRDDDDDDDDESVGDDGASKLNDCNSSADKLTNFTDCTAAVMLMCVNSTANESGMGCGLVDVVREVAVSVGGEVVLVEEAWNLVTAAVLGPNTPPPSAGSRALQLVTLARKVLEMVRLFS